MLDKSTEMVLQDAFSIAVNYNHNYITSEHLLLSLCCDIDILNILKNLKVNSENQYMINNSHENIGMNNQPTPTLAFQNIINKALNRKNFNPHKDNKISFILLELFLDTKSKASNLLHSLGITKENLINQIYISDSNMDIPLHNPLTHNHDHSNPKYKNDNNANLEILEQFCINLNENAKEGNVDLLIGREKEIERIIEILCRRRKNNVILVGDLAKLVAGAKYRGDFEERVSKLTQTVKNMPHIILFIDEIHTLIGAGSTMSGNLEASNLLKPALAKGEIRCIGSTTFEEYQKHLKKDMALARRFQKLIVPEPDTQGAIRILNGLKSYYEQYHGVVYQEDAIRAAVLLSERYIHDRHLPDKAIDLLDEAGAGRKIESDTGKKSKTNNKIIVSAHNVEILISSYLNIPMIRLSENDLTHLSSLESELKSKIFGQEKAIESLCSSIKLSRIGLKKNSKT